MRRDDPTCIGRASQSLAALSDRTRALVWAWLLAHEDDAGIDVISDCARDLNIGAEEVRDCLARLLAVGLVRRDRETVIADLAGLRQLVAELDARSVGNAVAEKHPKLAGLFSHGVLVQFPTNGELRRELSAALSTLFEVGRDYSETEVNEALSPVNRDFAYLRRLLVDEGQLARQRSVYRRNRET